MANHKSALKRAKQNIIRRLRNKSVKTRVKGLIKEVRQAVSDNEAELAATKLAEAKSEIDRASKKGVLHKNNASRKVSKLTKLVNSLA